jgi:ferredoxin
VNGKAKLVSDQYCDGLGACLKECPRGALTVEMREAAPYDEAAVIAAGGNPKRAHGPVHATVPPAAAQPHPHFGGCPGSAARAFATAALEAAPAHAQRPSMLTHWPIQLHLIHPGAPWFQNADVLMAADCAPFAMAGFHENALAGKSLIIACPKLDDKGGYLEKLEFLFGRSRPKSVTVVRMEVPCCGGLLQMVLQARQRAGSDCPVRDVVVGLQGEVLARRTADAGPPAPQVLGIR